MNAAVNCLCNLFTLVNASELDDRFLESLKALFGDRQIEIVVSSVDETDY